MSQRRRKDTGEDSLSQCNLQTSGKVASVELKISMTGAALILYHRRYICFAFHVLQGAQADRRSCSGLSFRHADLSYPYIRPSVRTR